MTAITAEVVLSGGPEVVSGVNEDVENIEEDIMFEVLDSLEDVEEVAVSEDSDTFPEVKERMQSLPAATGFRITYPMGDNKQVTKLTKIGGVVDRENKRVVFSFKTAAARTKFKKKYKDILDTIE
jgi:hypothetical protein